MNDINALREVLFDTLRGLKNKEDPLDVDRAKAINETAQTIINTAKVEVDFCRTTGQTIASNFIPEKVGGETPTRTGTKAVTQVTGGTITQHRLR